MPTSKSLHIKGSGIFDELEVFTTDVAIIFQNNKTDATSFFIDISINDWNELKKFIDEQLSINKNG